MNLLGIGILFVLVGLVYLSLLRTTVNTAVSAWLVKLGVFEIPEDKNIPPDLLGNTAQKIIYSSLLLILGVWLVLASLLK